MTDIVVTKLNQGVGTLLDRSIDLFGVDIHSFIIGDSFGFTPAPTETGPRGAVTFNGDRSLLQIKYFDNNESLRISMVIPEQYTGVKIGNIVLYALYRGQIRPVISVVMPNLVIKQAIFPEFEGDPKFKYPSNRLMISLTIKYVEEQPFDEVTINVISPEFSNIPLYGHSSDVPIGSENPYQQFIINQMDGYAGAPAFVTKDLADSYWTTPFWQDINSPKFGIIDGGYGGDQYVVDRTKWLWGGRFTTPDNKYNGVINGGDFTGSAPNPVLVGFSSF